MPSVEDFQNYSIELGEKVSGWAQSPAFYAQVGAILIAVIAAHFAARSVSRRVAVFRDEPGEGPLLTLRKGLFATRDLLFALITIFFLAIAIEVTNAVVGTAWLVRLAQSAGVVFLLYTAINRFITHPIVRLLCLWVGIPVATLQVFGWFDETANFLDGLSIHVGNIRLSIYFLIKSIIAGAILFWLGRISNTAGKSAIRSQESIDLPTRELFVKLFEIALFVLIFFLLLQVLGLDLTALTVFGGALGVGLGFGLQQIASNFISGIIILLERSLKVGDYIELEDGKAGILKELNMRSSALETFDGKEIMVPNEKFITTQFTNWTHADSRQRYEVEFSVAYDTDLHKVPPAIEAAVSKHPKVLQEPEKPDCELRGFGDSGVEFAVEFWVDGLDDGPNKFSSDVLFLVWDALKENDIEIPFPQREVRLKEDSPKLKVTRKGTEGQPS
ncbi:MAG: mechanosensitive ion channel [Hyphomicrobiaceae bacterium]|nr:mechanosensitive ion channel [Hyphomicrobiaceae bacterium]